MTTAAELHTLTGAFAVDALQDEERAEFARHLHDCAACAREVAEFRAAAARLGLAVAEPPPAGLRERVLGLIGDVRQEPPTPRDADDAGGSTGASRARSGAWRSWALAACLALAAALGGTAVWQHQQADDARQQTAQARQEGSRIAELLAAPDARTVPAPEVPGGGSGSAVVSAQQDRAAFVASGMAKPPRGHVYQLWFDDGGTMRSAGLLDPAERRGATVLDGRVDDASGMGITVEPAGGSPQPTSDPVVLLTFPG